jgi:hypothetical protein
VAGDNLINKIMLARSIQICDCYSATQSKFRNIIYQVHVNSCRKFAYKNKIDACMVDVHVVNIIYVVLAMDVLEQLRQHYFSCRSEERT